MQNRFTKKAQKVLRDAGKVAQELGHNYVGTEHLLVALIRNPGVASEVLKANGVEEQKILDLIDESISAQSSVLVADEGEFTPRTQKVLEIAQEEASRMGIADAGTEHLLIALLKESDCIAVRLLNTKGINVQKLYVEALTASGQDMNTAKNEYMKQKNRKNKSTTPILDQYSRDLTALAREGKLDPVIGREREIERIVQILSRRTKNNPCLIGEPGVGKTAVVEGLARKIIEEDIPEILHNKRVLTLDLAGMVAGSKYRGEFEERIKRSLKEVMQSGNILLFIDEIHTIIGAGGAEGAIDAANILKPSLARGELQLIGATTREEYRKYIEKDAALERRFQSVVVEEPTEEEAIKILRGLAPRYEEHHHVKLTDGAVTGAVRLAARYVNDRFLPDKAIDAIDEACARAGLKRYMISPELRGLEEEQVQLEKEKEQAIRSKDYTHAGEVKRRQEQLEHKIDKIRKEQEKHRGAKELQVTENEIAAVIADWTKIPVQKLQEEEMERLRHLEEILHERVVGQEEAVSAVSKAVRRGRVGLKDPRRPIGSFLFLGPTGVGKTELSKALAEAVFGKENDIIRVDMSEYMEKHSVSKMIGSPPGYVGYEDGGQLSEKVRRHPYSVILFDEIEKAHADVFNILLQILEDGHVTDAQGRKVSFKNTIIIMTSNAGAQRIIEPRHLGFGVQEDAEADYHKMKDGVMEEVKKIFKPEFINRIDEILVFHTLTKENIEQIVRIMLNTLNKRTTAQMNLTMEVTEEAVAHLAESGFDKNYGARPVRRAIQTQLEDALADALLDGTIAAGDKIKVDCKDKKIIFSKL
ncbi:ATP-dependent Clp protease ATP-binding subunit [Roseburia sp. AM59-24XD]|jgi:ATP-dependent Clp protease ATP-binding subunit ClpC|uniref:ATP-dependent Clp protease ATP-binding subunit n=1 Tax=Roseburia sp. AM59-24XD TaxID=2293138 RepID=UPI000E49F77A|nr:ATP-dependent Clp protease ATP-binding subunit [Roseburia sp. AM59-24XD]RHP84822.1 ATP-dependent Clp protease ATP-binding subunit [Roseburia sp. AM59-24XD]